jgi:hypothetical protein
MKDDEISEECSTHGDMSIRTKVWLESRKERDNAEGLLEDNIKTNLQKMGWEGVKRNHVTQNRGRWCQ